MIRKRGGLGTGVTHTDVFAENLGAVNPLLRQVLRRVLQRAELTDWQQAPGGGGGLVRGLLGGLMGASRALVGGGGRPAGQPQRQPGDFGAVLIFAVGGISPAEVRAELEAHAGPGKPRLILGGTSLLLPQDVVLHLAGGPLA
ncbi:hypothetical protein TSOC_000023 [Tetrabaena socialis]|uniref:Sec1 family domain-containing protein 2 n=1 Tax=Tetrabaena socialis TaxID=47790 RepID=A0A2J8AKG5_9CHLO|nr:hypothetical protein TSOC_000023 [Tetrabaena socialis]|eukprot:PNH13016.1 hypothetical protein TSOC_000023 [Tetrabaena socialis]